MVADLVENCPMSVATMPRSIISPNGPSLSRACRTVTSPDVSLTLKKRWAASYSKE